VKHENGEGKVAAASEQDFGGIIRRNMRIPYLRNILPSGPRIAVRNDKQGRGSVTLDGQISIA